MENIFKLSTVNKRYIGLVALIFMLLFAVFSDKSAYQTGRLVGYLLTFSLLPTLFAWIAWRLMGRKEGPASVTFNIVLSLLLFGQLGNMLERAGAVDELNKQETKFEVSGTDSVHQKEISRVMGEWGSDTQAIAKDWLTTASSLQSAGVLDYSLLTSDAEFDRQRSILRDYIEKTAIYGDLMTNSAPNIKARLSVLGKETPEMKGVVDDFERSYLHQKPLFEPLMQSHIEYGNNQIQVLNYLQNNKDEWVYENNQLFLNSDKSFDEFNKLSRAIQNNEETIGVLAIKLQNLPHLERSP